MPNASVLNTLLINNSTKEFIELLKKSTFSQLQYQDAFGKNLLQIAASKGNLYAVLWLIYGGLSPDGAEEIPKNIANLSLSTKYKTPLFLAIENGHYLIAQVLIICGANKQKTHLIATKTLQNSVLSYLNSFKINKQIFCGLILWIINNPHPRFDNRLWFLAQSCIDRSSSKVDGAEAVRIDILAGTELECLVSHTHSNYVQDKISLGEISEDLKSLYDYANNKSDRELSKNLLSLIAHTSDKTDKNKKIELTKELTTGEKLAYSNETEPSDQEMIRVFQTAMQEKKFIELDAMKSKWPN